MSSFPGQVCGTSKIVETVQPFPEAEMLTANLNLPLSAFVASLNECHFIIG